MGTKAELLTGEQHRQLGAELYHARRCLELVEANPEKMEDRDLAAAYEAVARAESAAGNLEEVELYVALGREALGRVEDADDRAPLEADFATIRTK